MDYRQAERVFRSADDLTFVLPSVDSQRPDQVFQYQSSPIQPVQRQFQGDFSWLVTVSPALSDFLESWDLMRTSTVQNVVFQGVQVPRTFHASIVVFNKRAPILDTSLNINGAVPSERTVYADILGSGLGGGDMVLRVKGLSQSIRAAEFVGRKGSAVDRAIRHHGDHESDRSRTEPRGDGVVSDCQSHGPD